MCVCVSMQLRSLNSPTTLIPNQKKKKKKGKNPFESISLVMFMGNAIIVRVDLSDGTFNTLRFRKIFIYLYHNLFILTFDKYKARITCAVLFLPNLYC